MDKRLFLEFLQGKTHTSQVDSHLSTKTITTCGVPQGLVLNPFLVLVCINDDYESSDKLDFFLFVDDTNIYMLTKT